MSYQDYIGKSATIRHLLVEEAQAISYETGFVQRESKLTGSGFVQMMVMGSLANPEATLTDFIGYGAEQGVSITEAGLQQRLTEKAVGLLEKVLAASLKVLREAKGLERESLAGFTQVNLLDSTVIQLPAALAAYFGGAGQSTAALKVQLSFDYLHGHLNALEVVAGSHPDQHCEFHVQQAQADSLTLFDLGYFKKTVFKRLNDQQAFFISRLQSQTQLFQEARGSSVVDLLALLRTHSASTQAYCLYLGQVERVPVRVIARRLPPAALEERRRKAHQNARRGGRTLSTAYCEWLSWTILMTNLPCSRLSDDQILHLYGLRWQIELIFKLWKSYAHLDHVRPWGIIRLRCQFYARFIGLALFHWLAAPFRDSPLGELSLPKAFRILQRYALRFLTLIASPPFEFATLLNQLTEDFLRFALKESRQKSPSTLSQL